MLWAGKNVVSEWRSVIAVSLNVGDDVCLIKRPKLYMSTHKHYEHDKDGLHGAGCARPWFRTAEPLGERH